MISTTGPDCGDKYNVRYRHIHIASNVSITGGFELISSFIASYDSVIETKCTYNSVLEAASWCLEYLLDTM